MKLLLSQCIALLIVLQVHAQGVSIGQPNPDSSAILEAKSTTQGVLLTRHTTAQRNQIDQPAQGLLVFDTDKNTLYLFDGYQGLPLALAVDPLFHPAMLVQEAEGLAAGDNWGYCVDIDADYAFKQSGKGSLSYLNVE